MPEFDKCRLPKYKAAIQMGFRVRIIFFMLFTFLFRFEIDAHDIPSGLSEQEIRIIAGLEPKPYPGQPLVYNSKGVVQFTSIIFGRFVAHVINLPPPAPVEPWKSLADKRFSYFRDLLDYLKKITSWTYSYRILSDGTYIFINTTLAFAIRPSDGFIFRGVLIENGASKFDELRWDSVKIWDKNPPNAEPCKTAAANLAQKRKSEKL